ncbi:hypothetical protein OHB12_07155 [Nocardia sp. NBC_01730]|uniref:hypothetical protein n=1 Tax=Nocardia sp. NBC_01730 TaxID=2975998 RepID=UPI002E0FCCDD|nr:hypothetical protein OHB12_07155 [Nocardia sp. NBC_01730]
MSAHKNLGVVVTVDQAPIGHDAAVWSAALAERLHCPLRIVYIAPEAHPVLADIVRPDRVPSRVGAHARDSGPGIRIGAHWSVLVTAALFTWILGSYLSATASTAVVFPNSPKSRETRGPISGSLWPGR